MLNQIDNFAKVILEKTQNKEILLIHHFDTDGITSGAVMGKCLKKLDKNFSFKTLKSLNKEFIEKIPNDKVLIFVDLASGSLEQLNKLPNEIFIIDHHEIDLPEDLSKKIHILNWHLYEDGEEMCSAATAYLLSKALTNKIDPDSATLGIIGTIGDIMERDIGPLVQSILKDSSAILKKGLLLYPSTRPLNKALEYCSQPYIPGVTGNFEGANELLREASIPFNKTGYKSLTELTEQEMKNLVTAVALRVPSEDLEDLIGNLFLVKFFNKLEDSRELSALINACSRGGYSHIALLFCMGNKKAKAQADKIYIKHKQNIVSGLKFVDDTNKIEGEQYIIINAKDKIQDTVIGTIMSILSMSSVYGAGKIVIGMAYNEDKIKVSARISGRRKQSNINLRDLMKDITQDIKGESGGHSFAAGCIISKDQETAFIDLIKKKLDVEPLKA